MYDFSPFRDKLKKIIDHVREQINMLRTGKANVAMLDPVKVQVYGSSMSIDELANINVPDPELIVIEPWDKNVIKNIEEAIQNSNVNLKPVVDQDIIRIKVTPLTEEKRNELVKKLKQKIESAKIMMRTARSDVKSEIEAQEGQAGISEDDIHRDLQELDQMMTQFEEQLEDLFQEKKEDLLKL